MNIKSYNKVFVPETQTFVNKKQINIPNYIPLVGVAALSLGSYVQQKTQTNKNQVLQDTSQITSPKQITQQRQDLMQYQEQQQSQRQELEPYIPPENKQKYKPSPDPLLLSGFGFGTQ